MKDFKRYFIIPATPEEVYLALTNEATIHLWTGDKVRMEAIPETEFSLWDGSIALNFPKVSLILKAQRDQ